MRAERIPDMRQVQPIIIDFGTLDGIRLTVQQDRKQQYWEGHQRLRDKYYGNRIMGPIVVDEKEWI